MNYLISEELGGTILNYLKRRPYEEVYQMVGELQQLQQVPDALLNNAEEVLKKILPDQDVKVAKNVDKKNKVSKLFKDQTG